MNSGGARRTLADYAALQHLTQVAAAAQLGVTPSMVSKIAARHGLTYAKAGAGRPQRRLAVVPAAPPPLPETVGLGDFVTTAPCWSALRDGKILETKGRYAALTDLAAAWDLPIRRVVARWHQLRAAR